MGRTWASASRTQMISACLTGWYTVVTLFQPMKRVESSSRPITRRVGNRASTSSRSDRADGCDLLVDGCERRAAQCPDQVPGPAAQLSRACDGCRSARLFPGRRRRWGLRAAAGRHQRALGRRQNQDLQERKRAVVWYRGRRRGRAGSRTHVRGLVSAKEEGPGLPDRMKMMTAIHVVLWQVGAASRAAGD